jgi:lactoylglutathione lyase
MSTTIRRPAGQGLVGGPGSILTWNKRGFRVRVNYVIVYVSDMQRSVSFYQDVLGLPLKFESPGWTEFATEGATLALHASEGSNPEKDDPQRVPAGRCHPGLSVPNLDDFHKRMVTRGVPCVQEPRETFGARIAQYRDLDGLVISVAEERRGGQ